MTATANLGGLASDSFADLEKQGIAAFNQLTASGFTTQEAEKALAPLLENILQLSKDKKLAIDDATAALIKQAQQDGIIAAQQESVQQVLKEGLGQIITLLKGDLPAAWKS